jgi:competence protein ComEA
MVSREELLQRVGRRGAIASVLSLVVVAVLVGWLATRPPAPPRPAPAGQALAAPAPQNVLVFVSGAVVHPGLYELSPDARIADAIAAAGGITSLANPGKMPNLAARVHDGRQVNVPFLSGSSSAAARIDINTAAEDELDAVPGMPPGLAAQIVQYRSDWGPFTSISQLHSVLGVDSATVSALGKSLRVVLPPQQ